PAPARAALARRSGPALPRRSGPAALIRLRPRSTLLMSRAPRFAPTEVAHAAGPEGQDRGLPDRRERHRGRRAGRAAARGAGGRRRDGARGPEERQGDDAQPRPRARRGVRGGRALRGREGERLRRGGDPRRHRRRRQAAAERRRGALRALVLRGGQAGGGDLPRTVAPRGGGGRGGQAAHLVPEPPHRHRQRRRRVARPGGRRGPGPGDEPPAGRPACLRAQARRGGRRGGARRADGVAARRLAAASALRAAAPARVAGRSCSRGERGATRRPAILAVLPRLGPTVVSVADLRRLARRRLPRMVFDYIDGGAEDERTLRANEAAFAELTWRPRSAVVHPEVDLRTTVLGHELSLPVILAPVGSSRMFWPRGEAQAAAAAGEAGTVYTLSTLSGTRMEEVREESSGPCWYQLYLCGGREVGLKAVARAKACGYSALVVTIDTPVAGMRERDVRNGSAQLIARRFPDVVPFLPQVLVKPGWVLDFWRDGFPMDFPNILLPEGPMPYADIGAQLAAAAVS